MPTPAELNYHPCARCRVLRPMAELHTERGAWVRCKDEKVCDEMLKQEPK